MLYHCMLAVHLLKPLSHSCSVKCDFAARGSASINPHLGLEVTPATASPTATSVATTTPEASTTTSCVNTTDIGITCLW